MTLLTKRPKALEIDEISNQPTSVSNLDIPSNFFEFNKLIGLPLHPQTGKPTPLTAWEIELWDKINKYQHIIINKSRKIGVTEFILRVIAFNIFYKYKGYDVMIVAQREEQAKEIISRFKKLFNNIKYVIKDSGAKHIEFQNGTRVFAFPSNAESFRGPDKVKCVFLDEASHFPIINDEEVLTALMPNLAGTNGQMFIVSTPRPGGFFQRIWNDEETDFYKKALPYELGYEYSILSREFIDKQRKDNKYFEQEYNLQFMAPLGAMLPFDIKPSGETVELYG